MTDSEDTSRLHDEPSRCLMVFPGLATGSSAFVLVEDDGVSRDGAVCRVTISLSWTPEEVRVGVTREGAYEGSAARMRVVVPAAERRTVILQEGVLF
jgi:alpha-glucosidase